MSEISEGECELHLASLGCDLPLRAIYERGEFFGQGAGSET